MIIRNSSVNNITHRFTGRDDLSGQVFVSGVVDHFFVVFTVFVLVIRDEVVISSKFSEIFLRPVFLHVCDSVTLMNTEVTFIESPCLVNRDLVKVKDISHIVPSNHCSSVQSGVDNVEVSITLLLKHLSSILCFFNRLWGKGKVFPASNFCFPHIFTCSKHGQRISFLHFII